MSNGGEGHTHAETQVGEPQETEQMLCQTW